VSLLERPLVLETTAPTGDGAREIALVARAIDEHVLLSFALAPRLELGVALLSVLHQTGSGPNAIRSQDGPELETTAVRDPRLGLSYSLLEARDAALALRADLAFPFGDATSYASAGRFTFAPSALSTVRLGALSVGAELGARLRSSVELGSVRHGSELYAALAVSLGISAACRLSLEAFVLPSLVDSSSARARELGVAVRSLPAEWLASLRLSPGEGRFWVTTAAGSGLPLSSETRAGSRETYLAPTSPTFRGSFELGFTR
jgi:hypothetical protein